MATKEEYEKQQDIGGSEVVCPIDGCDYTGRPNSVEAHISSMTRGDHSGKLGKHHIEGAEPVGEDQPATDSGSSSGGLDLGLPALSTPVIVILVAATVVAAFLVLRQAQDDSVDGSGSADGDEQAEQAEQEESGGETFDGFEVQEEA